jgi:hypothetical protein
MKMGRAAVPGMMPLPLLAPVLAEPVPFDVEAPAPEPPLPVEAVDDEVPLSLQPARTMAKARDPLQTQARRALLIAQR